MGVDINGRAVVGIKLTKEHLTREYREVPMILYHIRTGEPYETKDRQHGYVYKGEFYEFGYADGVDRYDALRKKLEEDFKAPFHEVGNFCDPYGYMGWRIENGATEEQVRQWFELAKLAFGDAARLHVFEYVSE